MSDYQSSLLDLQKAGGLNRDVTNSNGNYASGANLLESCASVVSFASYRSNASATNKQPVRATKDAVDFEHLKRKLKLSGTTGSKYPLLN